MHAWRRPKLEDLFRVARIAHVMSRKTLRPGAANRPHIGIALVDLDEAAAAPGGRAVMAQKPKAHGLLGLACRHAVLPQSPGRPKRRRTLIAVPAMAEHCPARNDAQARYGQVESCRSKGVPAVTAIER